MARYHNFPSGNSCCCRLSNCGYGRSNCRRWMVALLPLWPLKLLPGSRPANGLGDQLVQGRVAQRELLLREVVQLVGHRPWFGAAADVAERHDTAPRELVLSLGGELVEPWISRSRLWKHARADVGRQALRILERREQPSRIEKANRLAQVRRRRSDVGERRVVGRRAGVAGRCVPRFSSAFR